MTPVNGILTFLTDFGLRDAYVASMKGVALSVNRDLKLVDISHQVPPQDIMQAAYVLRDAAACFPEGTVHLCVVDPGVGTDRSPVAVRHRGQYFVGPDNGLLSLALDGSPDEIVRLDNQDYWRPEETSTTFHGRDIFAPAAAHLASGVPLSSLGSAAPSLTRMQWALPIHDDQGIRGWVVHVDHFGNCVTNITRSAFAEGRDGRRFKCYAGGLILDRVQPTYGCVESGDPLLLFNSTELLEVAVSRGNAAELFGLRTGSPINIVFLDGQN